MAEYFWDINDVLLDSSTTPRPMAVLANLGGPKIRVYRAYIYPVDVLVSTGAMNAFQLYRMKDPFSKIIAPTSMALRNLFPVARDPTGPMDGRFRAVYMNTNSGTMVLPTDATLLSRNYLSYSGRNSEVTRWTNSEWNGHPSLRNLVDYHGDSSIQPIVLNDSEGLFFWSTTMSAGYFSVGFTFSQEI